MDLSLKAFLGGVNETLTFFLVFPVVRIFRRGVLLRLEDRKRIVRIHLVEQPVYARVFQLGSYFLVIVDKCESNSDYSFHVYLLAAWPASNARNLGSSRRLSSSRSASISATE